MNILKWFASGPAAAEKVLDGAIRGIDALVFTEEEKAELSKRLGDQWLDVQKVMLNETSIQAVTRRVLAVMVMGSFTLLVMGGAAVYYFNPEYAKFLVELAESQFGWMAIGIMGFYFGPYMIQRMLGPKAAPK